MSRTACLRTIAVIFAFVIALHQCKVFAAALRTVALSGQSAPGAPADVNYGNFGTFFFDPQNQVVRGPVINDAGRAAFRANLAGSGVDATNNQGIWSEGSGSLALVARTGSAAPGVPDGVNFGLNPALELFEPVIKRCRPDRVLWRPHRRHRGSVVRRLGQLGACGPRWHASPRHTRRREP